MTQRLLTPPSSPLFQDTELREYEPLLLEVLNKEKKRVICDNNTREVHDADIEQDFTRFTNTPDISDLKHFSEERRKVDQQIVFCSNCIKYTRVHEPDQLKAGDSIRISRFGGLYYHHAIVKEVQIGSSNSCCTLKLIHLQKVGRPILTQLIIEQKTYDLIKDIVEKVIYKSNPIHHDEIVRRAEEYAVQNATPRTYDWRRNNCEQLSNQFAQGVKISHQLDSKLEQVESGYYWILNVLCTIGCKIMRIPGIAQFASIESLKHIIRKKIKLQNLLRDGSVCYDCYVEKYKKLKISLVIGVINLAVTTISHCNWTTLTISLIISIALPLVVPLVYKHIVTAFQTPKQKLGINNIPRAGDIITFDYQNLPHEGVVSNVHGIGSDMKRLRATIIHFPWPGLFKTYTVTEETIYFNQVGDISVLDFEGTDHLPASDVVKRAKALLGQQNHSYITYRSSHMSRTCKTGNKNLNPLPTVPVRSINDLSPGDVIRFRYYGLPHEAVLVRIAEAKDITFNVWNPRSCE